MLKFKVGRRKQFCTRGRRFNLSL